MYNIFMQIQILGRFILKTYHLIITVFFIPAVFVNSYDAHCFTRSFQS